MFHSLIFWRNLHDFSTVLSSPCFMFHSLILFGEISAMSTHRRSSGADQRKLQVLTKHLAQHTQEIKVPPLFWAERISTWGRSSVRLVLGICHGEIANSRVGICITKELGMIFWCGPENGV